MNFLIAYQVKITDLSWIVQLQIGIIIYRNIRILDNLTLFVLNGVLLIWRAPGQSRRVNVACRLVAPTYTGRCAARPYSNQAAINTRDDIFQKAFA